MDFLKKWNPGPLFQHPDTPGNIFKNQGTSQTMHVYKKDAHTRMQTRLVSGSLWAMGGKAATSLLGLAANFLLARILSPDALGAYFLGFSIVGMGVTLGSLGLQQTVVRLVAEHMSSNRIRLVRKILKKALLLALLGGLLTAFVLVVGPGKWVARELLSSNLLANAIPLLSVLIIFTILQLILAECFRGFNDILQATIFGGLVSTTLTTCFFFLFWISLKSVNLSMVLTACLLAWAISVTTGGLRLFFKTRSPIQAAPTSPAPALWPIAWPNWITTITFFMITQADIFILGIFRPDHVVALYGAAVKLVLLVTMPLMIVNAVVPPLIAEQYFKGKGRELETSLRRIATWSAVPALGTLVMFLIFGKNILSLVYGEYYTQAYGIVRILALGQCVNVCAGSCGMALQMTGHQNIMMKISLCCGVLMILLSLILARAFGPFGSACAAGISLIVQNIAMLLLVKKHLGISTQIQPGILIKDIRNMIRARSAQQTASSASTSIPTIRPGDPS
ncbi:MAG: flippase [Desulfoplanes sp.]|nr:flippase [Desulfoplanes sp.]